MTFQNNYKSIVEQLKRVDEIQNVSPYFTGKNGEKIGLTNFFYVKLKTEKDYPLLEEYSQKHQSVIVKQNEFMPLWYILSTTKQSVKNSMELANQFYESGQFENAEPDLLLENLALYPNDEYFFDQWGLYNRGQYIFTPGVDINVRKAWTKATGRNITVAVLDHGIQRTHSDLIRNIHPLSYDTVNGSSPSTIRGSHGTAVAGIIGATGNNSIGVIGVAPDCKLMSISDPLIVTTTAQAQLANGLNWAWRNGADVINNSWGHAYLEGSLLDDAILNTVTNGRNGKGCVVVFASGNDNSEVSYPAKLSYVIAVGGVSPCGERKSPTSCDGERWGANYGTNLDVVAPAVLIPTTDLTGNDGYNPNSKIHPSNGGTIVTSDYPKLDYTVWFNGTSAAAPHVAGIAALILSENPNLTNTEVRSILGSTCRKVGDYSYDQILSNGTWNNEMGYGLVDAYKAVAIASGQPVIIGPDSISRGDEAIYTLYNVSPSARITWKNSLNSNSESAPNPQIFPNTPTNNQCTMLNRWAWPVEFTLIASVDDIVVATKVIVSEADPIRPLGTYYQPGQIDEQPIPATTITVRHSQPVFLIYRSEKN
ncbi:MAG: S8 family serine peptidase [Tannerellaceae bacterium]|nr:S8 family serine peptidase [Tannerellaceae bacterium]